MKESFSNTEDGKNEVFTLCILQNSYSIRDKNEIALKYITCKWRGYGNGSGSFLLHSMGLCIQYHQSHFDSSLTDLVTSFGLTVYSMYFSSYGGLLSDNQFCLNKPLVDNIMYTYRRQAKLKPTCAVTVAVYVVHCMYVTT
jgi:hypothetical protein